MALEDLEKCEADPRYFINMNQWHSPSAHVCEVCFAGAVLAQSIGTAIDTYANPSRDDYGSESVRNNKLHALNAIRFGDFRALFYLNQNIGTLPTSYGLSESERHELAKIGEFPNPEIFKETMLTISGILDAEGL